MASKLPTTFDARYVLTTMLRNWWHPSRPASMVSPPFRERCPSHSGSVCGQLPPTGSGHYPGRVALGVLLAVSWTSLGFSPSPFPDPSNISSELPQHSNRANTLIQMWFTLQCCVDSIFSTWPWTIHYSNIFIGQALRDITFTKKCSGEARKEKRLEDESGKKRRTKKKLVRE